MVYQSYINGKFTKLKSTFDNTSPETNNSVFAQVADTSTRQANIAVQAAADAFPKWAALAPEVRADYLNKVADAIERNADEIKELLIKEVGSWIGKAMFELKSAPHFFRTAAKLCTQVKGYEIPSEQGKKSMVIREPLGVVSVITPWNVPLNLSARTTSGILAAGNTVVLKPSEESPLTGGWVLAKAFHEAGVPAGVFNVLTCSRKNVAKVGKVMSTHPAVKAVSFTGSTKVGKALAAKAGGLLKKVSMELGGKDAMIILPDADLSKAVTGATFASFFHAGQICMGTKRIMVHEDIATEFIDRFVKHTKTLGIGDIRAFNCPIAPLINERQVRLIEAQVEDAVSKGATLLTGGKKEGLFYEPTILTNVTSKMNTYDEESFGPLVSIYTFKTEKEAIDMVNTSQYGLSAAVVTEDEPKGMEVARQIVSGMCHVNDGTIYGEALAPFGGAKNSGIGRYGGMASIDSFTTTRWITVDQGQRKYPPPFVEKA